jgi:predicted ester cyclase
MSRERNIESSRAFFEYANAGNFEAIDALHAPGYTTEYMPGLAGPLNEEQNRMMLQGWQMAFPDLKFEVTLEVADEKYVVTHWEGNGTHMGPIHTPSGGVIEPTGKKLHLVGSTTMEIEDGKHRRAWTFFDQASLLAQLGLMPGP